MEIKQYNNLHKSFQTLGRLLYCLTGLNNQIAKKLVQMSEEHLS